MTTPDYMPNRKRLGRLASCYGAAGFTLALALMGGMELSAQGLSSHNTRAPVSVDAGRIEVEDRANRVSFSGNVVVTQADLSVRSQRMLLNYVDAGSLELQRLTATGGVVVSRGNEQATGDTAIYDFNRRIITMAGNVRLRQGSNNLSGGRLVIDLDTGISSVDGSASGGAAGAAGSREGRVRGTFTVPQGDN